MYEAKIEEPKTLTTVAVPATCCMRVIAGMTWSKLAELEKIEKNIANTQFNGNNTSYPVNSALLFLSSKQRHKVDDHGGVDWYHELPKRGWKLIHVSASHDYGGGLIYLFAKNYRDLPKEEVGKHKVPESVLASQGYHVTLEDFEETPKAVEEVKEAPPLSADKPTIRKRIAR